jgi:hypothetical protein
MSTWEADIPEDIQHGIAAKKDRLDKVCCEIKKLQLEKNILSNQIWKTLFEKFPRASIHQCRYDIDKMKFWWGDHIKDVIEVEDVD